MRCGGILSVYSYGTPSVWVEYVEIYRRRRNREEEADLKRFLLALFLSYASIQIQSTVNIPWYYFTAETVLYTSLKGETLYDTLDLYHTLILFGVRNPKSEIKTPKTKAKLNSNLIDLIDYTLYTPESEQLF